MKSANLFEETMKWTEPPTLGPNPNFVLFVTQEALDHLVGFPSSKETISQLGIEPSPTLYGLGTSPLSSGNLGSYRTAPSLTLVETTIFTLKISIIINNIPE